MKEKLEKIMNKTKEIGNKTAVPLVSFGLGAGLGALGKHTNHHIIPAVPIAMDVLFGAVGENHIIPYLAYGAGVAMNYLPEIYQVYQTIQNNIGG